MLRRASLVIVLLAAIFTTYVFAENSYEIDATHSTIGFAVSHVKVGITRGEFTDYHGEIQYDRDNLDSFKAWIIINTQSIDTRLEARDKHLRNEHFFDVENYPTIIFRSKKLVKKGNDYEITGDLTMRGVTKEVSGIVVIKGPVESPFGGEVFGMSGEVVIDRRNYGISWNDKMPDGGVIVGNDVRIIIDIEAHSK